MSDDPIPGATVARLPVYLRALASLAASGQDTVSSADLAELAGTQPAQLRRDLSYFGTFGTRGVGYDVATLRASLGAHVGEDEEWPLVLVGVGHLGSALASQFSQPPFRVVAALDVDPALVGTTRAGVVIRHQSEMADAVAETGAVIGVICTPADVAQEVCDGLVAAGVVSILNFAPTLLHTPGHAEIRTVDLAQELAILAFHESHRPR